MRGNNLVQAGIIPWRCKHTPFVQFKLFQRIQSAGLWEAGWSIWRIAVYTGCVSSVIFQCWQQCPKPGLGQQNHIDTWLVKEQQCQTVWLASTDQIKCSPKCINTNGGKLFTYNRIIGMYAFNQTSTSTVTLSYVPLVVLWGSEWYPIVFSDVYCMLHGFKEWCVPDYIQPCHTGLSPGLRASHIMMWENLSDNSCSLSLFVKGKVE